MADVAQNQLIASIARDLIAETAPQELPLFQATSEAYFKNPQKLLKNQADKNEMLGFGVVEVVSTVIASPIVINIVNEAVHLIVEEVKEAGLFKRLFGKSHSAKEEQKNTRPLTPELMQQIHQMTLEKAVQYKLPRTQAEHLADSLVAKLAMTYK